MLEWGYRGLSAAAPALVVVMRAPAPIQCGESSAVPIGRGRLYDSSELLARSECSGTLAGCVAVRSAATGRSGPALWRAPVTLNGPSGRWRVRYAGSRNRGRAHGPLILPVREPLTRQGAGGFVARAPLLGRCCLHADMMPCPR